MLIFRDATTVVTEFTALWNFVTAADVQLNYANIKLKSATKRIPYIFICTNNFSNIDPIINKPAAYKRFGDIITWEDKWWKVLPKLLAGDKVIKYYSHSYLSERVSFDIVSDFTDPTSKHYLQPEHFFNIYDLVELLILRTMSTAVNHDILSKLANCLNH